VTDIGSAVKDRVIFRRSLGDTS